jgi:hypothetical protein
VTTKFQLELSDNRLMAAVLAGDACPAAAPFIQHQIMNTINEIYDTYDKTTLYRFTFQEINSSCWRIYIREQPDYGGQPESGHATHRFFDEVRGQHYICWDRDISSLDDARKIAAMWAERTERYRKHGITF